MRSILFGALFLLFGGLSTQAYAYSNQIPALDPRAITVSLGRDESVVPVDRETVQRPEWPEVSHRLLSELGRILHDEKLARDEAETNNQTEKAFSEFFDDFATIQGIPKSVGVNHVIAMAGLHYLMMSPGEKVDDLVSKRIQRLWGFLVTNAIKDSILWEKQKREKAGKK